MNLFKLAFRNLVRKRKRLLVTVGAMGLAAGLIIFYTSLLTGLNGSMIKNIVENEGGHIQVHQAGYRMDPDLYNVISPQDTSALLSAAKKHGYLAAPRLYGFALVANDNASAGVELWGLDLEREPKTSRLAEMVAQGSWLTAQDPLGVLVGKGLASKLNLKPGSELVMLGQATDGSMANEIFTVRGVMGTISSRADAAGVMMSAKTFKQILLPPPGAHRIVIRVPGLDPSLKEALSVLKQAAPNTEVLDWRKLQPVIAKSLESQDVGMFIMMFIAYLAVGMVVFNAMLMNVFERISEFGIMKALGVTPRQVFCIISLEAFLEACLACILGLLLGVPGALWLKHTGLDLSHITGDMSFAGMSFEPIMYGSTAAAVFWKPLIFLFVLTAAALIYPAAKAARIHPVKAIYHR